MIMIILPVCIQHSNWIYYDFISHSIVLYAWQCTLPVTRSLNIENSEEVEENRKMNSGKLWFCSDDSENGVQYITATLQNKSSDWVLLGVSLKYIHALLF